MNASHPPGVARESTGRTSLTPRLPLHALRSAPELARLVLEEIRDHSGAADHPAAGDGQPPATLSAYRGIRRAIDAHATVGAENLVQVMRAGDIR